MRLSSWINPSPATPLTSDQVAPHQQALRFLPSMVLTRLPSLAWDTIHLVRRAPETPTCSHYSKPLKIFRVKDGELKTNMFSIWDSIGLFRELNIIPSKPWLKLIGHQWSIFSKAGDCMLRCIICTLPIYWSIIYLSLCYTYRYMYAYTRIKKLCTMYMIDNIMCLLFSITIY